MNKFIFVIIAALLISPKNVSAQNNNAAGIATAVGGLMAIGAVIATIENMKERAELVATEYILKNNPELQNFSLKTLDFEGKRLRDMSNMSVISFKIQEFTPSDNPKLTGKKQVLFGFTSYGWISEQGINFSKIMWLLIDKEEWMNMMVAYAKVSSSQKNETLLKQGIANGIIVNKGIKVKNDLVIPFYKLEGDMYVTMDYSPQMKFVYNERSLGIFLKNTNDLVQIGRDDLIRIHDFFMDK